jgi:hypothetical protein
MAGEPCCNTSAKVVEKWREAYSLHRMTLLNHKLMGGQWTPCQRDIVIDAIADFVNFFVVL